MTGGWRDGTTSIISMFAFMLVSFHCVGILWRRQPQGETNGKPLPVKIQRQVHEAINEDEVMSWTHSDAFVKAKNRLGLKCSCCEE